jgi:uncharacterized peroxidase-related enzyme
MSRYPTPELKDLPEDIRAKVLEVQEKSGFVPNVFLALARRPAEWRAFFAYHDALMMPESVGRTSNLSKGDREMIVTTTSAANHCLYCVVAHGAILRIYEKKPLVADQVAINWRKADITPRQRAMLAFAMKVCQRSHEIDDADFAALREHGFDVLGAQPLDVARESRRVELDRNRARHRRPRNSTTPQAGGPCGVASEEGSWWQLVECERK